MKFVDFDYMARVTQLNVADVATLASAPPPPEASLMAQGLTNDTTLQWKAAPGAAYYEIVWRATYEPTWTRARSVGDILTYTLKDISKDDWIFGVRAIDAAGHKGTAGYPQPVR